MHINKFIKAFLMLSVVLSVVACSDGYNGPIGQRPVASDDRDDGETPETKTLFEKVLEKGVPEIPLKKAFDYFDKHKNIIKNQNYMTIIDFSQHSVNKRYYLIDLKTGAVDKLLTAHGKGSDPDHTGFAKKFSNVEGSHMTSLGFMLTDDIITSPKHGPALLLDGLENMNSNVRPREIIIHGASYVDPSRPKMGRSLGCPAVENRLIVSLIKKIQGKSLVYSYTTGL